MKKFQVTCDGDWKLIPRDVTDIEILYMIYAYHPMIYKYYKYIKKVHYYGMSDCIASNDFYKFQRETVFTRDVYQTPYVCDAIHYYVEILGIKYGFPSELRCLLPLTEFLKLSPDVLKEYHYNALDEYERYYFSKKKLLDFPEFDILFRFR